LEPLVLVTGFGAFPGTVRNPSREIALALELAPPPGLRVRAAELPVSFEGAPAALEALLDALAADPPALILGLGVQRAASFRLERRARGSLRGERLDADGRTASELAIEAGEELATEVELASLLQALREAGAGEVEISDDAGGYVCERTYHRLLACGRSLAVPALFLHVPPAEALEPEAQVPIVRALLARAAASIHLRDSSPL